MKKVLAASACVLLSLANNLPMAIAQETASAPPTGAGTIEAFVPLPQNAPSPTVPTSSLVITPEIAAALAPVQNANRIILDIAQTGGQINVSGANTWTNDSNLIVISTSSLFQTATLSAQTIFNPANTSISTIIPADLSITGAISNLNLVLTAGSIYNAGIISSAGSLAMQANVIANVAIPTMALPIMQSVDVMSMVAPTILNQGVISSALSGINISSLTNSLAINSLGGTFSALNGTIQIGSPEILNSVLNINILGGDFLSKTLNLNADVGLMSASFNSVSGLIHLRAQDAYMGTHLGDLNIGHQFVNGDPYEFSENGNVTFSGITDVDVLSISAMNIVTDTTQGGVGIFSQNGISMVASGSINLTGAAIIATTNGPLQMRSNGSISLPGTQVVTGGGPITLVSDQGAIFAPGLTATSNGGNITIVGKSEVVLADGNTSATINSGKSGGTGGYIFIASQQGSINLGEDGIVTAGEKAAQSIDIALGLKQYSVALAAFNGILAKDVNVSSGELFMYSGVNTLSSGGGWTVETSGFNGSGGITVETLSTFAKDATQGFINFRSSNGDANVKNVTGSGFDIYMSSSKSIVLEEGITNKSNRERGGTIIVGAFKNIEIPDGIMNDSLEGIGGQVFVSAGQTEGLIIGSGGLFISNNAATDGGAVDISNFGPLTVNSGGIEAKANAGNGSSIFLTAYASETASPLTVSGDFSMANASANGQGGYISLIAQGPIQLTGSNLTANGSGSGAGGYIEIISTEQFSAAGVTLTANGGSDGRGGYIVVTAPSFQGGDFNLIANGQGTGLGGSTTLQLTAPGSVSQGQISMTATGANGGTVSISSVGNLTVDTSVYNVAPTSTEEGYGDGGEVFISSDNGMLSLNGDIHADASGSGRGGRIELRSGGLESFTLGGGSSKLFARGGSAGSQSGNGGTIKIASGGDLTILADAVISTSVRGENGQGGYISLQAGDFFAAGTAARLQVEKNISANGKGTGNGGTIFLSAAGGKAEGAVIVNGNLQANSGKTGVSGGVIGIDNYGLNQLGATVINGTISANAGEDGKGGTITVGTLGEPFFAMGTPDLQLSSTSKVTAYGGTTSGNGGEIKIQGAGTSTLAGTVNASARGSGDGGKIWIASQPATANASSDPSINISGSLSADGGQNGTGGKIEVTGVKTPINVSAGALLNARGGSASGKGGEIKFLGNKGMYLEAAILSSSGRGTAADGGLVSFESREDVDLGGGPIITFASLLAPTESENENPTEVSPIRLKGTTVKANAGTEGIGGDVRINAKQTLKTLDIQTTTRISADGGSKTGNGGQVTVAADDLTEIHASSISASAKGIGNGGLIRVSTETGYLSASGDLLTDAGTQGTGGEVSINGNNDVSFTDSNIYARGGSLSGSGGAVSLSSGKELSIEDARIVSSPRGSGNGEGGTISILGGTAGSGDINFTGTIAADGEGNGDGGTVTIRAVSGSATFNHPASDAELISATGGSFDSANGNGGTIIIAAAGDLSLQSGQVEASAFSQSGRGGKVELLAGENGDGLLTYNFDINANGGRSSGNGGIVNLRQSSPVQMNVSGNIIANSVGDDPAGTITYENSGNSDFAVVISGKHKVDGVGKIFFKTAGSVFDIDITGDVNVGKSVSGELGTISFEAASANDVKIHSSNGIGKISGQIDATVKSFDAELTTPMSVKLVKATDGDVNIKASTITVVPDGKIEGQNVFLEASKSITIKPLSSVNGIAAEGKAVSVVIKSPSVEVDTAVISVEGSDSGLLEVHTQKLSLKGAEIRNNASFQESPPNAPPPTEAEIQALNILINIFDNSTISNGLRIDSQGNSKIQSTHGGIEIKSKFGDIAGQSITIDGTLSLSASSVNFIGPAGLNSELLQGQDFVKLGFNTTVTVERGPLVVAADHIILDDAALLQVVSTRQTQAGVFVDTMELVTENLTNRGNIYVSDADLTITGNSPQISGGGYIRTPEAVTWIKSQPTVNITHSVNITNQSIESTVVNIQSPEVSFSKTTKFIGVQYFTIATSTFKNDAHLIAAGPYDYIVPNQPPSPAPPLQPITLVPISIIQSPGESPDMTISGTGTLEGQVININGSAGLRIFAQQSEIIGAVAIAGKNISLSTNKGTLAISSALVFDGDLSISTNGALRGVKPNLPSGNFPPATGVINVFNGNVELSGKNGIALEKGFVISSAGIIQLSSKSNIGLLENVRLQAAGAVNIFAGQNLNFNATVPVPGWLQVNPEAVNGSNLFLGQYGLLGNNASVNVQNSGSVRLIGRTSSHITLGNEVLIESGVPLFPISHQEIIVSAESGLKKKKKKLEGPEIVSYSGIADSFVSDAGIVLNSGEIVLAGIDHNIYVFTPAGKVCIGPGAVVGIEVYNGCTAICTYLDRKKDSVIFSGEGFEKLTIPIASQVVCGERKEVTGFLEGPNTRRKSSIIGNNRQQTMVSCERSPMYVLPKLKTSLDLRQERHIRIFKETVKSWAALSLVTVSHGSYK